MNTGYIGTDAFIPGSFTGRLTNIQVFNSTGTSTYNSTPGTTSIIAVVQAGGGGSGGLSATSGTTNSIAQCGASGAYAAVWITAGFTGGITVTVGIAGTAGSNAPGAGGAGRLSSFGTLVSCPGGLGGSAGGLTSGLVVTTSNSPTAAPTISGVAATLASIPGDGGAYGVTVNVSGSQVIGGHGGNSPLGTGGVNGTAGTGFGAGAGGGANGASGGALAGHAGTQGIVIVYEYA